MKKAVLSLLTNWGQGFQEGNGIVCFFLVFLGLAGRESRRVYMFFRNLYTRKLKEDWNRYTSRVGKLSESGNGSEEF